MAWELNVKFPTIHVFVEWHIEVDCKAFIPRVHHVKEILASGRILVDVSDPGVVDSLGVDGVVEDVGS